MGETLATIRRDGWDIVIETVMGRSGVRYVVRVARCPLGVMLTPNDFAHQYPSLGKARRHAERLTRRRPARAEVLDVRQSVE